MKGNSVLVGNEKDVFNSFLIFFAKFVEYLFDSSCKLIFGNKTIECNIQIFFIDDFHEVLASDIKAEFFFHGFNMFDLLLGEDMVGYVGVDYLFVIHKVNKIISDPLMVRT